MLFLSSLAVDKCNAVFPAGGRFSWGSGSQISAGATDTAAVGILPSQRGGGANKGSFKKRVRWAYEVSLSLVSVSVKGQKQVEEPKAAK